MRLVIASCERARRRAVADEWLRPTLLAAAFAGDPDKAEELVDDVVAEGAAKWKVDAILRELNQLIRLVYLVSLSNAGLPDQHAVVVLSTLFALFPTLGGDAMLLSKRTP